MPEPLEIRFEDNTFLRFTHLPGGFVRLEARGSLNPTATAIEIDVEEVANIRAWLNKQDAAKRADVARETVAPKAEPLKRKAT